MGEPAVVTPVVTRVVTPYGDLDEVLAELLGHWRRILGEDLVGAYVQGSFALGAGDRHSDCDWLVTTRGPLADAQIAQLRALHDEIPTRDGPWFRDLEGSYAPVDELASVDHLGRPWLFNDHGHRTLARDDHCNRAYTRQRYAVVTACRTLYTVETAQVASKPYALEWAMRTLDRQWQPLLAQVRDERDLGWVPGRAPRPGEAEAARRFVGHVCARAARAGVPERSS